MGRKEGIVHELQQRSRYNPLDEFKYSLSNAKTWIKNDIEHYLKLKGTSKTSWRLGASELFGKKGIFKDKLNELKVFLEKKGLNEKAKPFLDSIERNLVTASSFFDVFFRRFMVIDNISPLSAQGSRQRKEETEKLEKEVADPLLGLIQKMKKDISSIEHLK